jgi:hypothetical protein
MNWRRGLLLAGVHLAVAGSLIAWLEIKDAHSRESAKTYSPEPQQQSAEQEGETVTFDLCTMIGDSSFQERFIYLADIPAVYLTGWHTPCPPRWTLAGMLHIKFYWQSANMERQVDFGLLFLILIQWFLIGGYPLIRPKRWWWEPGTFITLCIIISLVLILNPWIDYLSGIPILFAFFAWFWWFGLLIWKSLQGIWRLARRGTAPSY